MELIKQHLLAFLERSFVLWRRPALADIDNINGRVLVVDVDSCITSQKTYKVMSKSDLQKILDNEIEYLSPFASTYTLFYFSKISSDQWRVHFYFIDTSEVPVDKFYFVLPLDYLLINDQGRDHWSLASALYSKVQGKYREKIAKSAQNNSVSEQTGIEHLLLSFLTGMTWLNLQRIINPFALRKSISQFSLPIDVVKKTSIIIVAALTINSLYLYVKDAFVSRQISANQTLVDEYANLKQNYFDQLAYYEELNEAFTKRGNINAVFAHITAIGNEQEITFTDFEKQQGIYKLSGEAKNVEDFIKKLAESNVVSNIQYDAPVKSLKNDLYSFVITFTEYHES